MCALSSALTSKHVCETALPKTILVVSSYTISSFDHAPVAHFPSSLLRAQLAPPKNPTTQLSPGPPRLCPHCCPMGCVSTKEVRRCTAVTCAYPPLSRPPSTRKHECCSLSALHVLVRMFCVSAISCQSFLRPLSLAVVPCSPRYLFPVSVSPSSHGPSPLPSMILPSAVRFLRATATRR